MQVYINNQETNPHHIIYDEHFYKKYIESKEIHQFDLSIELEDFNEKMEPEYEELLRELIEDDELVGENYALELFETLTEYPSYEDVLDGNKISMREKMDFLNTFFVTQILNEYFWQQSNVDNKRWIIKEVVYFNKKDDQIIIRGNVQRIN